MADVDKLSSELGIPWEETKDIPFGTEVPFIGFTWNLTNKTVELSKSKKAKYLEAIILWNSKQTHTLDEVRKLYGKLLHTCLVIPSGRAYLTSLEAFMGNFHHSPFMPRTPPRNTASDLQWWATTLSQPSLLRSIPGPTAIINLEAYSDASSEIGIGITIGTRWRAWRLLPDWKREERDIGWAEAVGFLFLVLTINCEADRHTHYKVFGDNRGVVEGWWKGRSRNGPTNNIFRSIHDACQHSGNAFLTRYVPSASNPADNPSRGIYDSPSLLLPTIPIPDDLKQFVADYDAPLLPAEIRLIRQGTAPKPQPKRSLDERLRERQKTSDDADCFDQMEANANTYEI